MKSVDIKQSTQSPSEHYSSKEYSSFKEPIYKEPSSSSSSSSTSSSSSIRERSPLKEPSSSSSSSSSFIKEHSPLKEPSVAREKSKREEGEDDIHNPDKHCERLGGPSESGGVPRLGGSSGSGKSLGDIAIEKYMSKHCKRRREEGENGIDDPGKYDTYKHEYIHINT
jgi:hypothetical protein